MAGQDRPGTLQSEKPATKLVIRIRTGKTLIYLPRQMNPGSIGRYNPEINLAHCGIEKSPKYQERFDIEGTPTLFFMMNGEIKETISGSRNRDVLEEIISRVMFE